MGCWSGLLAEEMINMYDDTTRYMDAEKPVFLP